MKPLGFHPIEVIDFFAYPKGSPHYGKIKVQLNNCPFKEGEEIDIDTEQIRVTGKIERIFKDKIIIVKMETLAHKERIN